MVALASLPYNVMVRTETEGMTCLSLERDPNFSGLGTPTSGETSA